MKYNTDIFELIGKTPMVQIGNGCKGEGPILLAKLEFFNPGGSVKDRFAEYTLRKAVKEGRLKKGDTIIDCTSGNTGVALAMVASVLGLKAVLTIADKNSQEKIDLIKSYGAEVIVTPAEAEHEDPEGAYMMAETLAKKNGWFHTNQYHNPDNALAHYNSTGPEIWNDTEGKITHLVAGIGTGGTLSGTAQYLKEKNPAIQAIAVDPEGSIFTDYINDNRVGSAKAYKVEGIGSDCITEALDPNVVDRVITANDNDAFKTTRLIAKSEGLSVGGSAGAAIWAARQVAAELSSSDIIVVIVPDSGTRYLSKCFNDIWMRKHGFAYQE
jgi:cystathionine beta-synthase